MKNRKSVESFRDPLRHIINLTRSSIITEKKGLKNSQKMLENYLKMISKYGFPIDKTTFENVMMFSNEINRYERLIQENNEKIKELKYQIAECEREYL